MAVLDGRYEILSQRQLERGQTLFAATDPEGRALHIVWFDLASPQQELRFESYRQLLRTLKARGQAAIHDIVSRPGAHYVAWYAPGKEAPAGADPELSELLNRYGYRPQQAEVRLGPRDQASLYALAFDGASLPLAPPTDAPPPPERARPRPWLSRLPNWALIAGLSLALYAASAALLALSFVTAANNRLEPIPDVIGMEANAAAGALHDLGLAVSLNAMPGDAPPYSVTASDPPPGSLLRPGQQVRLSYAVAPGQLGSAQVPQLRGLSLREDLQARLEGAQLRLGTVSHIHANTPEHSVIAQSLPSGSLVAALSSVDVLVSLGPQLQQTFLPDLTGLSLEEALEWARLAGVQVTTPEYASDPRALPGTVVNQNLPPFAPFPAREASLRLTLAGTPGSESAMTPSLVGLSEAEAERLAREAGLSVSRTYLESANESLNLPEGVISQTPPPGGALGDAVTLELLVNLHPRPVPVPPVSAGLRAPEPRALHYTFVVEQGIARRVAEVTATTLSGQVYPVETGVSVQGGDRVAGVWETLEPGPVTFTLYLGGAPYQEQTRHD